MIQIVWCLSLLMDLLIAFKRVGHFWIHQLLYSRWAHKRIRKCCVLACAFPLACKWSPLYALPINWAHRDVKCHNWTGESRQRREPVSEAMLWHFIALLHPLYQWDRHSWEEESFQTMACSPAPAVSKLPWRWGSPAAMWLSGSSVRSL